MFQPYPYQVSATYFLGSRFMGTSEFTLPRGQLTSLALFCPQCGEIWFRVACKSSGGPVLWTTEYAPCPQHKPVSALDWGRVPGSVWRSGYGDRATLLPTDWALCIEHLPVDMLRHELEIALREAENA